MFLQNILLNEKKYSHIPQQEEGLKYLKYRQVWNPSWNCQGSNARKISLSLWTQPKQYQSMINVLRRLEIHRKKGQNRKFERVSVDLLYKILFNYFLKFLDPTWLFLQIYVGNLFDRAYSIKYSAVYSLDSVI